MIRPVAHLTLFITQRENVIFLTRLPEIYVLYMIYDIYLFNCNWVATRWQLFSTHIHTNNTGNVTKQTSHRTTQKNIDQSKKCIEQNKIHRATKILGRVRAVPRLCGHHPGTCLTTEEKARKYLSQGSHT
jgi:hypothetical protein